MPDISRTTTGEVEIATESATEQDTPEAKEQARVQEKLALARRQFKTANQGTDFFREQARLDQKFRAGTWGKKSFQWPDGIQQQRENDGRPCMTVNRAPTFIRLVTNQARGANLRIRVNPVDDNGDPAVAEILQGVIRNIETQSFADRAYSKASEKQAEIGLGFFRIITEWADPEDETSFRQRIRVKWEKDPLKIYIGHAEEPDWSDARYAFKVTDVDKDEYMELAGIDDPDEVPTAAALEAFEGNGDQSGDWFPNGKIRIAEWFNLENAGPKRRIAELSNGDVIPFPTPEDLDALRASTGNPELQIRRSRWVQPKQMMWRKIDALHIHEESVWVPKAQPWIPVIGDELEIDGVKDFRGVVRDSQGSAMAYNVEVTGLVEQVGLGTKAPVVGYRGQFGKPGEPIRRAWENAGKQPVPFLEVEPIDIGGEPAPKPDRVTFEPPLEGTIAAIRQTDNDYKATAGWHDPSLAERGPQESGKAIKLRQDQDLLSNSHYLDNLRFALCAGGRQLIKLIRVIYDVPTVVRIVGKDEHPKKVMVFAGAGNDPRLDQYLETHPGPGPLTVGTGDQAQTIQPGQKIPFQLPDGVDGIYDIGVGEFDVEVSASKDSGTRRQEELELVGNVLKGLPPDIGAKFLDLFFMLLDSTVGRQMTERAKKLFPPPEDNPEGQPDPAQMAQQMTMMREQVMQIGQALQAAHQEIAAEREKLAAQVTMAREKNASTERVAAMKIGGEQAMIREEMAHQERLTALEGKIDSLTQQLEHIHAFAMHGLDHASGRASAHVDQENRDTDRAIAAQHRVEDRADAHADRDADEGGA